LTGNVEPAIKEFDAAIELVESIKDIGNNWQV